VIQDLLIVGVCAMAFASFFCFVCAFLSTGDKQKAFDIGWRKFTWSIIIFIALMILNILWVMV
jgi:hypothetical protein